MIVFKRERGPARYHVYAPNIYMTKDMREQIWDLINNSFFNGGTNIIDPQAATIRIEGFKKWDTKTNTWVPGSAYHAIRAAAELEPDELLKKVFLLPKGWPIPVDATVIPDNSARRAGFIFGGQENDAAEAKAEEDSSQREGVAIAAESNPCIHPSNSTATINKVQLMAPEAAHILLTYPINQVHCAYGKTRCILDKSDDGKRCPIAGKVHERNNTWLHYHGRTGKLFHHCFDPVCIKMKRNGLLIHNLSDNQPGTVNHNNADTSNVPEPEDLPAGNDVSLADYFCKWNPRIKAKLDGKTTVWLVWNDKAGYYKSMTKDHFMKYILNNFTPYVFDKYQKRLAQDDVSAGLEKQWYKVREYLNATKHLEQLEKCLRWKLMVDPKDQFNSNRLYTVFENGVLQWDKTDPDHPELPYYFGPTRPEELVTDEKCMKYPFNCPPVSNGDDHIRQAEELLETWIKLVQPNPEDRLLLLQFISISFLAENYKKMIVNIGAKGNNSKSSCFEMVIHCFGKYGIVGDKKLIIKTRKDKVSEAEIDRVRFILFEEPDAKQSLDLDSIKDLVGGSNTKKGRMNYSNENNVTLHSKIVLNANVMTTVALESAILERLLYLPWLTVFTTIPSEVNPEKRVYEANGKFKTEKYWKSVNDGLIWLLLNHFRLFQLNGNRLSISARQQARTKRTMLENDLFIRWFTKNYQMIKLIKPNKKYFITIEELQYQFGLLTSSQQAAITCGTNYEPDKFVSDMARTHSALIRNWRPKVTNFRITKKERKVKGAVGKMGPNKQYQGASLICCMEKARFDNLPLAEQDDLMPVDILDEAYHEEFECEDDDDDDVVDKDEKEAEYNDKSENDDNDNSDTQDINDDNAGYGTEKKKKDKDIVWVNKIKDDYLDDPQLFYRYTTGLSVNDDTAVNIFEESEGDDDLVMDEIIKDQAAKPITQTMINEQLDVLDSDDNNETDSDSDDNNRKKKTAVSEMRSLSLEPVTAGNTDNGPAIQADKQKQIETTEMNECKDIQMDDEDETQAIDVCPILNVPNEFSNDRNKTGRRIRITYKESKYKAAKNTAEKKKRLNEPNLNKKL